MTKTPPDNKNNPMDLWDKVCKTNPKNTKEVKFGRKFTAIDAYSQIEMATRQWGPYGSSWGLYDIRFTPIPGEKVCDATAKFRYPGSDPAHPIEAFTAIETHKTVRVNGQPTVVFDTDYSKKAVTDMITKSLSMVGFNADVFMGKFDDNQYVHHMHNEFNPAFQKPVAPAPNPPTTRQTPLHNKPDPVLAKTIERLSANIFCMKKAITEKDDKTLKEVWEALTKEDQLMLWTKEKEFGPFSNVQRHYINRIRTPAPTPAAQNPQAPLEQSAIANSPNTVAH